MSSFCSFSCTVADTVDVDTHPELLHLTQLIELRRGTKLDMAQKCLDGLVATYERRREADEHTAWNWWSVSIILSLHLEQY